MSFIPAFKKILVLTGVALLASATAFAQQQQPGGAQQQQPGGQNNPSMQQPGGPGGMPTTTGNPNQPSEDKAFVHEALQGGLGEVQLGQLAAQKGSTDSVKQFGQKMVDDHTKLNNMMMQVAQQTGVKPPTGPSKKDNQLAAKLQGLSGTQFDDAYIKAMVKDHKKDLDSFKMEAQQAQIPAVKQAAQQGAPVIQSHLELVQQIAQSQGQQNGKSKSSGMQ